MGRRAHNVLWGREQRVGAGGRIWTEEETNMFMFFEGGSAEKKTQRELRNGDGDGDSGKMSFARTGSKLLYIYKYYFLSVPIISLVRTFLGFPWRTRANEVGPAG